jgi:hypothetical protein
LKEKVEQDAASVIAGYTRMQAEMEVAEKSLGDAESDRSKYSSAISEMQARHTSMTKNMKLRHEKLLQAIAKAKKEKKVLVQEVRNLRERTSSIGSDMLIGGGVYPAQLSSQKDRTQSDVETTLSIESESITSTGTGESNNIDLPNIGWSFAGRCFCVSIDITMK